MEDVSKAIAEKLQQRWLKGRGKLEEVAEQSLSFAYQPGQHKQQEIVEALAFWAFIQKRRFSYKPILTPEEGLRGFLKGHLDNPNPLVRVVALIEFLPDSLWRKILWKGNIDFMSFESFLRRIDRAQVLMLETNYADLFERRQIPRVFGRLERWWKRITPEGLLAEKCQVERRYASKGSMSYNLLGIDFGFNAYPKGESDDTRVVEVSPLTFLSVKNHADDFVVNTEDGKYWQLYRWARSNYVWRPKRRVKLNTHICPGFWYTILIHLWFWIVSPALVLTAPLWFRDSWWYLLPTLAMFLTPVWILMATAKWIVGSKLSTRLYEAFGRHEEQIKSVGAVVYVIVGGSALVALAAMASRFIFKFLHLHGNLFIAITVLAAAYLYLLGYRLVWRSFMERRLWQIPKWIRSAWYLLLAGPALDTLWIYRRPVAELCRLVGVFLAEVAGKIWEYFAWMGAWWILFVFPLALYAVILYGSLRMTKEQWERWSPRVGLISLALFLAMTFGSVVYAAAMLYGTVDMRTIGVALLVVLFYGAVYRMALGADPKIKSYRHIAEFAGSDYMIDFDVDPMSIARNKWLAAQSREVQLDIVQRAVRLIRSVFNKRSHRRGACNFMVAHTTEEVLAFLEENKDILRGYQDEYLILILGKIFQGVRDFKEAEQLVDAEAEIARQKRERINRLLRIVGSPLLIIWWPIKCVGRGLAKVWELIATLYKMRQWFNRLCPFVTQSAILQLKIN